MENEEGFDKIIDPETNKAVPIESAVGQQVIKNYLTIMNGGSEDDLISTKKYYKSSSTSSKPSSGGASKLSSINENNARPTTANPSSRSAPPKQSSAQAAGSVRGLCKVCKKNVLSNQERVKVNGDYYHEACFKKIQKK